MSAPNRWKPGRLLRDVIADTIREALIYCDGNKSRAAALLGLTKKTVNNWTRDHARLAEFYHPKAKLSPADEVEEL